MKIGISIKIDVTKINKAKIFIGKKGKYINLVTFINTGEEDKFGNSGFISQEATKEEKANGVKENILGNCKIFWCDESKQDQGQIPKQEPIPENSPF